MDLGPDAAYLSKIGFLEEVKFYYQGFGGEIMLKGILDVYNAKERAEPGRWALAQNENSFLIKGGAQVFENRGLQVTLHRAIPVPDYDVPLDDILNFKDRRRPELLKLRTELDLLYQRVHQADDQAHAVQAACLKIDLACRDLLKVASESWFAMMLSDWKMSINLSPYTAAGAAMGWIAGGTFEMPEVTAILGAAAGSITLARDVALGRDVNRVSPYRYVLEYHENLFISGQR